jgi:hypothetical protein
MLAVYGFRVAEAGHVAEERDHGLGRGGALKARDHRADSRR